MKKSVFTLALVLGMIGTGIAQENVSIGPMVGLSVANLRGDIVNNNWKTGATLGGFYNYSSESGFGFSGQLLYTQLGADINNKTNEINLHYLQVPLLLTYFMGRRGEAFRPKLFVGPSLNFLLGAKDINGNDINGEGSNSTYRPFDLGATAGIGFNYRVDPKVWLNFDVRYGVGLVDITRSDANKRYNQNVGINLGVSFPFGTYNPRTGNLNTR
jgi:hypothetical protein